MSHVHDPFTCEGAADTHFAASQTAEAKREDDLQIAISLVASEYRKARRKFSPMASGHEGYAVILEELDELWDEIKANRGESAAALNEATQVAAMAVAYMVEVAGK